MASELERILSLPAGRELDAIVAKRVMGWDVGDIYYDDTMQEIMPRVRQYSQLIADAWEVVEKIKENGDMFIEWWSDNEWTISNKPVGFRDNGFVVTANTAPLAIVRAALKAVMDNG